jgi:hypothetical protein
LTKGEYATFVQGGSTGEAAHRDSRRIQRADNAAEEAREDQRDNRPGDDGNDVANSPIANDPGQNRNEHPGGGQTGRKPYEVAVARPGDRRHDRCRDSQQHGEQYPLRATQEDDEDAQQARLLLDLP